MSKKTKPRPHGSKQVAPGKPRSTVARTGGAHAAGGRKPHAGADHRKAGTLQGGIDHSQKDSIFFFGRHAVEAALRNPRRECLRLILLDRADGAAALRSIRPGLKVDICADETDMRAVVPPGSPHQGVLLEVRALPGLALEDLAPHAGVSNIILMLDQVTDPHNVGACLRSAAAFGARAVLTQDRHSPHETGVLARAASGGLENTPWVRVANLSQALEALKDMGYWHVGLDGHTDTVLGDVSLGDNIVIVMGSEGTGLRPLVRKHCDAIAKIPMTDRVESLNVSNAAAIALYELSRA